MMTFQAMTSGVIHRTRVKFCGMTRIVDALIAAELGVDAIGVVLTRKSKRFAGIECARQIRSSLPPFTTFVALFMDDDPLFVTEAIAAVAPGLLQFHGSETAPDCVRYGLPYIKSVAMGGQVDWQATLAAHPQACGFLFDGHATGEQGGTGKTFDWSRMPTHLDKPLFLAGGLTPENVGAAIAAVHPYAVDVASGIESLPGIKDADKMRRFVEEVQRIRGESGGGREIYKQC